MAFEYPPQAYQNPSYLHGMMGLSDNHGLIYDQQIPPHVFEMSMTPQSLSTSANSNGSTSSLPVGDRTETKPRLQKDEVARLEEIFSKNHKPNSNTKRNLADQMRVDVARINNWFQNRRAKAKQEKKQDEFEQRQKQAESVPQEDQSYSSQEHYAESYDQEDHSQSSFSSVCGAPATMGITCQPQYDDPAAASIISYERTIDVARAAHEQGAFANEQAESSPTPGMSFPENCMSNGMGDDRAQFPSSDELDMTGNVWTDENGFRNPFMLQGQPIQFHAEVEPPNQDPIMTFNDYSDNSELNHVSPLSSNLLPSQLLNPNLNQTNSQAHDDFVRHFEQPEFSKTESNDKPYQPQPDGLRFGSTPGSANIAIRRRGFQPPSLGTTPRSASYIGPKTTTQSPTINRAGAMSPGQQQHHMRRIMSAASLNSYVNMNGSRIQKSYPTSAQRSPINFKGFADADTFIESNAHNIKRPSLPGSIANSVRPPPTPMSPQDLAAQLQREMTSSSSSSSDDTNRRFESKFPSSYFMASDFEESKLASPPVTPAFFPDMMQQPHWSSYSVSDESLHTPGTATFGSEPYSWLSNQPDTPGLPPYLQASGFSYNTQNSPQYGLQASASCSNEHSYNGFSTGFVKSSPNSTCSKELLFENHTAKDYEAATK